MHAKSVVDASLTRASRLRFVKRPQRESPPRGFFRTPFRLHPADRAALAPDSSVRVGKMATVTVTTLSDENDAGATVGTPGGTGLSLREAIVLANAGSNGNIIYFPPALSGGTIRLTSTRQARHRWR